MFKSLLQFAHMKNTKFKKKLEKELALLEEEMGKIGRRNPSNPNDWEPMETDMGSDSADPDQVADEMESFGENAAVLRRLEAQYNDVKRALEKIKNGTYGKCEAGGEKISEERLEANPSARTCVEHAKSV